MGEAPDQQDLHSFNKEEIERIRSLLTSLDKPSGSYPTANAGTYSAQDACTYSTQAFSASLNGSFQDAWVIDSGATDHMTNSPSYFSTYTPCSGHQKIRVADGTLASIAGT